MDRSRWRRAPKAAHALPTPWHRRKLVWAGIAVAVAVGVWLMRPRGGDPFVEPAFNTTSTSSTTVSSTTTTTLPVVDCIEVANPSLLITIDATAASAVATDDWWFVAKANGATWLTTADPARDAEGELLPMNDQARVDSESRRDVRDGDPRYEGHTDDEAEADAARSCAATG